MSWKEIEVTSVSDLREGDRVNGMPVVWTDDELGFGKTCEWFHGYLAGGGKVERLVDEGPMRWEGTPHDTHYGVNKDSRLLWIPSMFHAKAVHVIEKREGKEVVEIGEGDVVLREGTYSRYETDGDCHTGIYYGPHQCAYIVNKDGGE
jgi:hypothetical protein